MYTNKNKNYTLFLLKYSGINCVKIIKVNIRMFVQPKKSHMPCKISDSRPHRQSSRREKMDPSYFLIWNWRTSPTTKWVFEKWFKTLGVVEVYRMTDMVWYYYSSGVRTHWIIFCRKPTPSDERGQARRLVCSAK